MDPLTQDQIVEALTADPTLLQGVTTHVLSTDKGTEIVNNRANLIYDQKIGDEVRSIHSQYDNDAFTILGEKPEAGEDGQKVKTYDFIKGKLTELKQLRELKSTLNESEEVKRLNKEIEKLKDGGGGAHWKQTYETAQNEWKAEKEGFTKRITTLETGIYSSNVESQIDNAKAGLKFNPDVPEAAINAMYASIKSDLISKSKKDGEKTIFLKDDGSAITDSEYKTADALFVLKERMKDVLLTESGVPGGEAQETIAGSIKTTKVEGQDDQKSLVLDTTKFKTRVEFRTVAIAALQAEGVTRNDKDFQPLIDKAYKEYKIDTLPRS